MSIWFLGHPGLLLCASLTNNDCPQHFVLPYQLLFLHVFHPSEINYNHKTNLVRIIFCFFIILNWYYPLHPLPVIVCIIFPIFIFCLLTITPTRSLQRFCSCGDLDGWRNSLCRPSWAFPFYFGCWNLWTHTKFAFSWAPNWRSNWRYFFITASSNLLTVSITSSFLMLQPFILKLFIKMCISKVQVQFVFMNITFCTALMRTCKWAFLCTRIRAWWRHWLWCYDFPFSLNLKRWWSCLRSVLHHE